jgi:hypothetical protein
MLQRPNRGAVPTDSHHPDLLRRIRALCAKADASDYPEEAEAFLAKAQELMARHAIDAALLSHDDRAVGVVCRTIVVPAPYASGRASLLAEIASANQCRVVLDRRTPGGQRCFLMGHATDVALVTSLHERLAIQSARALAVAHVDPARPRAFRHAFLLSYAARIGARLRRAAAAGHAAEERSRGCSVALALEGRRAAVDRALAERFPLVMPARRSASSARGIADGHAAADGAALGHAALTGRHALPRGDR